ncbi:MAG: mechanosensitive ion channel [Chloroflexi bacterium]|nr:mechanosensitive ion channel [Chloroflexota bacterium]
MDTFSQALQDLLTHFVLFLPKLMISLVIFTATLVTAGMFGRTIQRIMERRQANEKSKLLMGRIGRWSIIILGSTIALQQVDFDVTAFLTGVGILGFTVGFALQGINQNFVDGILLLLQQPFDISDTIQVGDFLGEVVTIDMYTTKLRTFDGTTVLIPNADVLNQSIINYGDSSHRRVEVSAGVAYDSDLDFVHQTATSVINDIAGVIKDPAPNTVFNNLGSPTIDFTIYCWIDTELTNVAQAKDAAIRALKIAFEQTNIVMPIQRKQCIYDKSNRHFDKHKLEKPVWATSPRACYH